MAPKKAETQLNEAASALLFVLSKQENLKLPTNELPQLLGLNGPKNVTRKLNSMIEPYGYKFEGGKFVETSVQNVMPGSAVSPSGNDEKPPSKKEKASPKKRKLDNDIKNEE